jgi:hypothetical protein
MMRLSGDGGSPHENTTSPMNKTVLRLCIFFALAASASAEIIGVEQFDYPNGAIAGQSGGTFWDYKDISPAGHTGTASSWQNVGSAPATSGAKLITSNSSARRTYDGASESDGAVNDPASAPSSVAHTVYYRVTVTTGATLPDFFGLSSYDFTNERIFFGKTFGSSTFSLTGGTHVGSNNVPVAANTTYTLVTKIDFVNDVIALYVNPDLNALESSQTPAANATYTGTNFSTAVRLASGNTSAAVTWDDLVVATTWDDLGTVVTTTADEDNGSLVPTDGGGTGVSLREAVKYSPSGALITFAPALNGQTINLLTALPDITKSVTIQGPGANLLTVRRDLNAATDFSVFTIAAGVPGGVSISGITISNGRAAFSPNFSPRGGGILANSPLTLTNVHVTGNHAWFGGGVLLAEATGTFTNCTFSGNSAERYGGGIHYGGTGGSVLRIVNSTISGNRADFGGAGINYLIEDTSSLAVINSTIANNATPGVGGGIFLSALGGNSPTTLRNTIIAGNAPTNLTTDGGATVTTLGFNLASDDGGGFLTNSNDITNADPRLGPLSLNGGQTPTHALLGGSPALDAGDASGLATDQRGQPRVFGASADIGAVEMRPIFVTNTTDSLGAGTFRQAITDANANGTGLDDILFAIPPFDNAQTITLSTALPDITSSLTINGPGANLLTVQRAADAATAFRVFNIPGGGLNVAFSGLTISNGLVNQSGGGIQSFSNLVLTNVYVTANQITGVGSGGGGVNLDGADGVFTSCTFSGNTAGGSFPSGGGIRFSGGPSHRLRLVSSTVSGNSANGGTGGGIFHVSGSGGSQLEVVNTTIANNSAPQGGGALTFSDPMNFSSATTTFRNSIIANNTANNLEKSGSPAAFVISQGFNLASDNGGGFLNVAPITTDKVNANAGLGPLAFNGGPTPTRALMFNSAALDAGNNSGSGTLFDQRGPGFPRTTDYSNIPDASGGDGTDIGAVEGTALTITAISHQTNGHTLLQGFGAPNLTYIVEASPDLSPGSFVALPTTVTADGTGALQYNDATAVGLTKRFYRLRFP